MARSNEEEAVSVLEGGGPLVGAAREGGAKVGLEGAETLVVRVQNEMTRELGLAEVLTGLVIGVALKGDIRVHFLGGK